MYNEIGPALRTICLEEIEKAKAKFQWTERPAATDVGWGLPRYVNTQSHTGLPKIFKQKAVRAQNFAEHGLEAFFDMFIGQCTGE